MDEKSIKGLNQFPVKGSNKMLKKAAQKNLIGDHPIKPNFFAEWLSSIDLLSSRKIKHRKLSEINDKRELAVKQIAEWLITHHIDEKKLAE
jgi:hypothetical protein